MSLFCRVGMHSWYYDGAFFTSVQRCAECGKARDVRSGERRDQERRLWGRHGYEPMSVDLVKVGLEVWDLEHPK